MEGSRALGNDLKLRMEGFDQEIISQIRSSHFHVESTLAALMERYRRLFEDTTIRTKENLLLKSDNHSIKSQAVRAGHSLLLVRGLSDDLFYNNRRSHQLNRISSNECIQDASHIGYDFQDQVLGRD